MITYNQLNENIKRRIGKRRLEYYERAEYYEQLIINLYRNTEYIGDRIKDIERN